MKTKQIRPVRNMLFSLRDIFTRLDIDDSPCLGFVVLVNGKRHESVLQYSHVTEAELLSVPGFADSIWKYSHTTNEWIPVFRYAGSAPITDFIDQEASINRWELGDDPDTQWCTPKGFPRKQYA
jgi:hypothetical protein